MKSELRRINRVFGVICLALLLNATGLNAAEGDVATKTVPGQKMFAARNSMPVAELFGKLEGLATRLASKQIRAGGEVEGPLHILIEGDPGDSPENQESWLAFPTGGNPRSSGRNRTISTKSFHCTYLAYDGPAEGISSAVAGLASDTEQAGYRLTGEKRFVFSCDGNCSRERMIFELQLGIE